MIPLTNYDFQGSGEQWGRDEIYPDLSLESPYILLVPLPCSVANPTWKIRSLHIIQSSSVVAQCNPPQTPENNYVYNII